MWCGDGRVRCQKCSPYSNNTPKPNDQSLPKRTSEIERVQRLVRLQRIRQLRRARVFYAIVCNTSPMLTVNSQHACMHPCATLPTPHSTYIPFTHQRGTLLSSPGSKQHHKLFDSHISYINYFAHTHCLLLPISRHRHSTDIQNQLMHLTHQSQ